MSKIILIGMPGSGKTTAGKGLSSELSLPFVDLDDIIIESVGMEINTIFSQKGEDYFRIAEQKALHKILSRKDELILSTGGGTPCFFDNIDQMNKAGKTIFIDVPMADLADRISRKSTRPLLNDTNQLEKLNQLYTARLPFYNKAQMTVTPEKTKMDLIKKLARLLR